ncbi:Serine/threonine-protein phosphatase 6 regulatory ankyrin repeat subunit C [Lachnellula occidentalis]|uniref:Serine/threonine-protein phosphatase 6 regulatory ankyrin repeat subunit C n=1 Tax=Lachnellula occidentalis TaxID=215460 RepID=A0A8H8S207_9HELO|nr:Serine/threonine-protein phosphatase 6 regulatory ankyrin repeat subunit C [Lachnellula occidentalis]
MSMAILDNDEFVLVERHVTPEDLEKIRTWLSPTDFESEGSEYRKHLNTHVAGTGDWIFETEQYRNWHDAATGSLWIQGIPGSGKSVVAANIIHALKNEATPVLFFFSRRIIKSNSEPGNLVRDCLYQFLDHSKSLQARLKSLIEQHSVVGKVPFHELWRVLLSAFSTVPRVYILLDALDELEVEEDDLLQRLLALGQLRPDSTKLIMTSRPLPHLQAVLKGPSMTDLRLTGRVIAKDINKYVDHRLANQQEKVLTEDDESAIKQALDKKSRGLFLYARLMLDEILQQSIPVHAHLLHLPSSLEDMYINILHEQRLRSGSSIEFQSHMLSWVTHASRPLRVTEIAALVKSRDDCGGLKDSQDAKLMIRTSCGPLVEILDDETVQVIHHSFTEFLLDRNRDCVDEITASESLFPVFTPMSIHRSLAISCLRYLSSGCFATWSTAERPTMAYSHRREEQRRMMVQFHFLQYASQNLLYHAGKLVDFLDSALENELDGFFQYGSHNFESWKDFLFSNRNEDIPDGLYPIHIAAQAGMTDYAKRILEQGEEARDLIDSCKRTAIAYAAMHGNVEVLEILLKSGARYTVNDYDGLEPIHHAAKGNHAEALQCLMDVGAYPLAPKSVEDHEYYVSHDSTLGKTPVQYACELGNEEAVSLMLNKLTEESKTGSLSLSLILPQWAAATGQAKVLETLLQHPEILANIDKKDVHGKTALYVAACVKDSATVQTILQHGADVSSRSDSLPRVTKQPVHLNDADKTLGHAPLHGWASVKRRMHKDRGVHSGVEEWAKTAKLLLAAGADIEARDPEGQTVLFLWTEQLAYGHGDSDRTERFLELLLRHGANPRVTDYAGNTPLHLQQKWNQSPRVVPMLVKWGAEINARRKSDLATPLIAAAKSQSVHVKEYIDNGADPSLQDSEGNTALHHICASRLFELSHLQEWLTFADPTIKNNQGETCLYNMRFEDWPNLTKEVIPLLVKDGLDLESKDRLGRTALLAACQHADARFIFGLLEYGASAVPKDFQGKSSAAVQMSNEDHGPKDRQKTSKVMGALIKAGADINAADIDGNTPFHDAMTSTGGVLSVKIRLDEILKLGGLANVSDYHGRTALHKVAALSNHSYDSRWDIFDRISFLLQPRFHIDINARDNQGITAIHCAASALDSSTWMLFQAGADLCAQANDGRTPLLFAAGAAQSNAVALLCKMYGENSWDVNHKDETGRTALHYATSSGNSESVYYLLNAGANPNSRDKYGLTALHVAAESQVDMSETRAQLKPPSAWRYQHLPDGLTRLGPLMDRRRYSSFHDIQWKLELIICQEAEACMIQDVVGLLLSAGAKPDIPNQSGRTAYDVALLHDFEDMAVILSSAMASAPKSLAGQWSSVRTQNAEALIQNIDIETADPYTLLQTAIYLKNDSLLHGLLRAGVSPTALGPEQLTPVHTIAHWGLKSMMKIVASHVEDLNIFSPPLLHAAASRKQSNIQMVELLIALGANVSAFYQEVDDDGCRSTGAPVPSYAAAHILAVGSEWWNSSALEKLCEAGADLEITDGDGNTVLQCALNGTKCGSQTPGFWRDETLDVLLKHGANINALSPKNGQTPLIAALESKRGHKIVKRLLDSGANVNLGEAPAIFTAIESGDPEAIGALIDAGAEVNTSYRPKKPRRPLVETPLIAAAIKEPFTLSMSQTKPEIREAIMDLLLQRGANPLLKLLDGETTVLHQIARNHGLIQSIVKAGADLEIQDVQGRTPLLSACSPVAQYYRGTEDESTPRDLILGGANIHAKDKAGSTTLHLAAESGLEKTVTLLLAKGAPVLATNNAGICSLYYTLIQPGWRKTLKLTNELLSAGADPLSKGPNGETALHLLSPRLLQHSPNTGEEYGVYPSQACDKRDILAEFRNLYQRFVDGGCERNGRDDNGDTPLFPYVKEIKHRSDMCTIETPAEEDVRNMFDGHDVFAVNYDGDTLLHAVAGREDDEEGQTESTEIDGVFLFKELVARGVDPRKENKKGLSALDVAAACGRQSILGLFARE